MRHNAFVVMATPSPLRCEVDDPQLVRDRLRGSQVDATYREQLATARRPESFNHAAIAEELQDIRQNWNSESF